MPRSKAPSSPPLVTRWTRCRRPSASAGLRERLTAPQRGSRRAQSEEDWGKLLAETHQEYASGAFLLERLGAERYLDPKLIATLLKQRQSIIAECGITTAAETMLVDLAVVHYALALRVQGWIGDFAVRIEHEFFGDSKARAFGSSKALCTLQETSAF
jgi:hypothetical protein